MFHIWTRWKSLLNKCTRHKTISLIRCSWESKSLFQSKAKVEQIRQVIVKQLTIFTRTNWYSRQDKAAWLLSRKRSLSWMEALGSSWIDLRDMFNLDRDSGLTVCIASSYMVQDIMYKQHSLITSMRSTVRQQQASMVGEVDSAEKTYRWTSVRVRTRSPETTILSVVF